jgi:hypothetical protein
MTWRQVLVLYQKIAVARVLGAAQADCLGW